MANCSNYMELSPKERVEFIGRLVHAAMSSDYIFNHCESLIKYGEKKGLFEGVTINPSEADQQKTEL